MIMRPSVHKPDILANAESAKSSGRGTVWKYHYIRELVIDGMSTTDTAEKEHKGNDTAEDELQSEPLDPEERLNMLFYWYFSVPVSVDYLLWHLKSTQKLICSLFLN